MPAEVYCSVSQYHLWLSVLLVNQEACKVVVQRCIERYDKGPCKQNCDTARSCSDPLWNVEQLVNLTCNYYQMMYTTLQCESSKKSPLGFLAFFPKQFGILRSSFTCLLYVPIYATLQIFIQLGPTCNFDEVMPYYARPPSSHHVHKMFTNGQNACWHFLPFFPNS